MRWPKLFSKENLAEPVPPAPLPPGKMRRAFALDRDRMFDLGLTSRLHALFAHPRDRRDAAWIEPQVRMLLWYLPPHSAVLLRPETVGPAQMTPLDSLFPAVRPEAAS